MRESGRRSSLPSRISSIAVPDPLGQIFMHPSVAKGEVFGIRANAPHVQAAGIEPCSTG
jgi:hypothetical protein